MLVIMIFLSLVGRPQSSDKWSKRTSILSRSFIDCLLDKDVIGYFMQFLTSKEYGHLLKFWMTAQNFYDASTVRIRGQSLNSSSQSGQTAISSTSNPKHAQSATQTKPPAVTAKVLESSVDDLLESQFINNLWLISLHSQRCYGNTHVSCRYKSWRC